MVANSGYLQHAQVLRYAGDGMTRFCPYCGVAVPSNCITCPRCFKNIPSDNNDTNSQEGQEPYVDGNVMREKTQEQESIGVKVVRKNRTIMTILAIIPAFVGILGLAQIYRNYRNSMGYVFLVVGLLLFIPSVILIMGVWNTGVFMGIFRIAAYIILTLIYLSTALAALLDARHGSVFKVIKF